MANRTQVIKELGDAGGHPDLRIDVRPLPTAIRSSRSYNALAAIYIRESMSVRS
ncbi:hypothetical protein [Cohnella sp. GCM10012308]|uniref:hypothetical protein n=1 Tax=Cohnella sp. GCM10012308 TaxID=3317329 RepID=UPI00361CA2E2